MKRMMFLFVVGVMILLISLGYAQFKSNEYTIGAVLSLTGKGAKYGESIKRGIDLALNETNTGSSRKFRYRVVYEDSLSESQKAVFAFKKLIDVDKVSVIIGPVLSSEVLACAPIANNNKVILFNPSAGSEDIRHAGDYIFRNRESAIPQAYMMAEFVYNKLHIKNMAVLYSMSPNGKDYMEAFIDRFKELGGAIATADSFEDGSIDFRTQIIKIKSADVEGVFLAGLAVELGYILKQSKELNLNARFFSSAGIEDPKLFDIAGDAAEGVIFGSPAFDPLSNDDAIKKFVHSYKQAYGGDPDFFAANAYDAFNILTDAIDKNGYTSDPIKQYLYALSNYPGAGGITSFDKDGEVRKPVRIKVIKGRKFLTYE